MEPKAGEISPLIAVIGATGSGKSAIAVELAIQMDGEVVNADAIQLYRGIHMYVTYFGTYSFPGLDIASAKISFEEVCSCLIELK